MTGSAGVSALVALLIVGGTWGGSAGAETTTGTDPAGDVIENGGGTTVAEPRADITGLHLDYSDSGLVVTASVSQVAAESEWLGAETSALQIEIDDPDDAYYPTDYNGWLTDVTRGGVAAPLQAYVTEAFRYGNTLCQGSFSTGASSYTLTFPASCFTMTDPSRLRVRAIFVWDWPGAGNAVDVAPTQFVEVIKGTPAPVRPERTAVADGVAAIDRSSRAALSAAVAADRFTDTAPQRVVVTTGERFPDALAAAPLAGPDGVVLFTEGDAARNQDAVPAAVQEQLRTYSSARPLVFVLGGTAAVSDRVVAEVGSLVGRTARRIAGQTRVETAALVAQEVPPSPQVIVARASGGDAPNADALAAGAYATAVQTPILLTDTNTLSSEVRAWLSSRRGREILVVGGTAAIADGALNELRSYSSNVRRIAGDDRYRTATAIASNSAMWGAVTSCSDAYVVGNGLDFGAPLLGAGYGAPVLLTAGLNSQVASSFLTSRSCSPDVLVLGAQDVDAVAVARGVATSLGR